MKSFITTVALIGALCSVHAQSPAWEDIQANRFLSGSNYVDYDRQLPTQSLTPAPRGYVPFYMSHYGRHGSRWLIGRDDYKRAIRPLIKAEQQGKLTAEGLSTLRKLEAFLPTTQDRLGDLTTVGERQHHGIGRRMAEHFPELFVKTKRLPIDARSTVVNRCILSMVAECEELMAANPTARIHNDVSESLQYYLNQPWQGEVRRQSNKAREVSDRYRDELTHPERLCGLLFNDSQWVNDSIHAASFMRHLFEVAVNMQSHDTDIELLSLFTTQECYDQWRMNNIGWYLNYGATPLKEGVMPFSQKNLLRNIIETADTVTQAQATLRFGHEVCVLPLACLMELGSCGVAVENLDSLDYYWQNYRIFPMACNIQLIFYRPKKVKRGQSSDILVKALLNEREMSLPVPTTQHPYYRWADVRQYWMGKLEQFEQREKERQ